MDDIELFSNLLGQLEYEKENILSDITCAILRKNKDIFNIFFDFMFPGSGTKPISIIRECDMDKYGRNDFVIYTDNGDRYFVESKINDQTLNLGKYLSNPCVKTDHLAYIIKADECSFNDSHIYVDKCRQCFCLGSSCVNYRTWGDFAKKLTTFKNRKDILFYLTYINRISAIYHCPEIDKDNLGKMYINLFNDFINRHPNVFVDKSFPIEWKEWRCYGNHYANISNNLPKDQLCVYVKYSPEYGYMFIFGINQNVQAELTLSDKVKYKFNIIKPIGDYFHDGWYCYYVPLDDTDQSKNNSILDNAFIEICSFLNSYT